MSKRCTSINQKPKKTKVIVTMAILLTLTLPILTINIPIVDAQIINRPTHSFITLSTNPIGVNQTAVVTFRIVELNPLSSGVFESEVWKGFTIKITRPDGTSEIKGPFNADTTGGYYTTFIPTQTGEYKLQAFFPGQWVNGSYTNVANTGAWSNVTGQPLKTAYLWFEPSESPIVTLTVQQDQITYYPNNPLPEDTWTRPIYGENKGWHTIADNWLMRGYDTMNRPFQNGAAFAPYTSAPESSHILWKKPLTFGGIAGGKFGDKVYYTGLSYETFYEQLILNGRIYYQDHGPVSSRDTFGTNVLDLYTGEQIIYIDNIKTDLAQVLDFESPNEHGLLAFTWSLSGPTSNGTWTMYDAFTGIPLLTITNVTSGSESAQSVSTVFGPNGELLSYSITGTSSNRRLIMWNSTLAIVGFQSAYFSPQRGTIIDGRRGIQWNVSIPQMPLSSSIIAIGEDYILTQGYDKSGYPFIYQDAAFPATLKMNADGTYPDSIQPLWVENRTNIYSGYYRTPRNIESGVYCLFDEAEARYHGYDIKTGRELWKTEPLSDSGWSVFTYVNIQAYGNLYTTSFDGHVRAFDVKNGQKIWDFYMGPAGLETPYGHWPSRAGFTVADGKIYTSNDEHTPDPVMWRGGKLYCLDAYTGEQYWNLSGWMRNPAISDGILTAVNSYDNQIYTIGKGPSATSVTASDDAIPKGSTIMIRGSITDQSPGQKGTPCISDQDMSAWMEYLHMQKPKPSDATGVSVDLVAVDSNGHVTEIGTAISDMYGNYGLAWTPPSEGTYQIVANFAGTNSYGSSSASTYIVITDQPIQPIVPTATPTQTSMPTQEPTHSYTPSPIATSPSSPGTQLSSETLVIIITAIIIIAAITATSILIRRRH